MAEHKDLKHTDFDPQQIASMVHVGNLMGDPTDNEFDEAVQRHMKENDEHEANFKKMRAAQQGADDLAPDLAPGQFEQQQMQQAQALNQQATQQGAQQAQQAQGQQMPITAPTEAPGPAGSQQPYPAQKGQQPPSKP